MTLRIAMWSGPRNISTAMMRSWENRPDCSVVDEPFYAAYLADTGLEHPCRNEILLTKSTDYGKVIEELTSYPVNTPLQYQKQMTHHIPRGMSMGWCAGMKHCFLIRDPAEVIASYVQKMPEVDADAIGICRQAELFAEITGLTGETPAVIDSNEVLMDPEAVLGKLCAYLEVPFLPEAMLHWPSGRRDSDGIWASHWYRNVERSTGFGEYTPSRPQLSAAHRQLAAAMQPYYDELSRWRLRP
ncbi:sulfotransferase-like domain-containing protein [Pseudohalioglobus sediminis]|nr:hypothetical protein [Pseudohalioglobus sediminis]